MPPDSHCHSNCRLIDLLLSTGLTFLESGESMHAIGSVSTSSTRIKPPVAVRKNTSGAVCSKSTMVSSFAKCDAKA